MTTTFTPQTGRLVSTTRYLFAAPSAIPCGLAGRFVGATPKVFTPAAQVGGETLLADTSQVDTVPPTWDQSSTESYVYPFDFAALLAVNETILSATVKLTNLASGVNYTAGLSGAPVVTGTKVLQRVVSLGGNKLQYDLIMTITTSLSNRWSMRLRIISPF